MKVLDQLQTLIDRTYFSPTVDLTKSIFRTSFGCLDVYIDFRDILATNLACAGFILDLSNRRRFSIFNPGPILLLTSFIMSAFSIERNCPPSTP